MPQYFLYAWLAVVIVLMMVRPRIGLGLYIPYFILIPYFQFPTFNYLLLVVLVYRWSEIKKIEWGVFVPFLFYFATMLVLIPFHSNGTPVNWQLNNLRGDIVSTLVFPILMANEIRKNPNNIVFFSKILIGCIVIACVYGIYLTQTKGFNPYVVYMGVSSGAADARLLLDFSLKGTGRLFGRISSCFYHPMTFALFLGLSMIFILDFRKKMRKKFWAVLFFLLLLNMLLCGVRSVIAAAAVSTVFFLLYVRQVKIAMVVFFLMAILYGVVCLVPELQGYLSSIVDVTNKAGVQGSSFELRLSQLEGCFFEIRDNPLFGKGYAWHMLYLVKYTVHPVILCFESVIFVQLCDNGMFGLFALGGLILGVFRYVSRQRCGNKPFLLTLFCFYLSFSTITGEYGYLKYFMLFYILMLGKGIGRCYEK